MAKQRAIAQRGLVDHLDATAHGVQCPAHFVVRGPAFGRDIDHDSAFGTQAIKVSPLVLVALAGDQCGGLIKLGLLNKRRFTRRVLQIQHRQVFALEEVNEVRGGEEVGAVLDLHGLRVTLTRHRLRG